MNKITKKNKMNNIILEAVNINKSYSVRKGLDLEVLHKISLSIFEKEIVAIVGPSGVGKSTLLHILSTLDKADSGDIYFNDEEKKVNYSDFTSNSLSKFRNKSLGFIFQAHYLLPEFTALENVCMPAFVAGANKKLTMEKAHLLLARVGMTDRAGHKPQELSGGEQQRIAIARALINSPKVIFADEPTGNLDSENSRNFIELIKTMKEMTKTTFVIATHSLELSQAADRIMKMKDGAIEMHNSIALN